MKNLIVILLFTCCGTHLSAQIKKIGGPCEGCEAIYESPVPFDKLEAFVKLPGASWDNKKPIAINGIIYQADGKTPAPDVVLYLYHTNEKGVYPKKGNEKGWGKRHGYLRGWVKTDQKGAYKFVSVRPAPYPDKTEPAHIHATVKEPNTNEYYIDEFVFSDDPLLTPEKRFKMENRGGSGILQIHDVGNMFKAERNIYLGKNIPDYSAP